MILLIPSVRKGNGGGHLKRALSIAECLEDCRIFLPEEKDPFSEKQLSSLLNGTARTPCREWGNLPDKIDFVLLDQRKTPFDIIKKCKERNLPMVAMDEGGPFRYQMDYLIDSFPLMKGLCPPNLRVSPLIKPGVKGKNWEQRESVLLSFGMEDPAGLTEASLEFLIKELDMDPEKITLVVGPLFFQKEYHPQVKVLDSPDNLQPLLGHYKLILTSFGLTAYEALEAGANVLLLNPSEYHNKLSLAEGFQHIGVGRIDKRHRDILLERLSRKNPEISESLSLSSITDMIKELDVKKEQCPCCKENGELQERFQKGNFYRCSLCCNLYFIPQIKDTTLYNEDYFFDSYEKQYGKTYLEDFEHIQTLGIDRLKRIKKYCGIDKGLITDLGCAYGPFLEAAGKMQFFPRGIDVSEDAVGWVREKLGWECHALSLESEELEQLMISTPADVLTLWYVIEHFPDQEELWKRLSRWTKKGGALALATPYGNGISYRKNTSGFYRNSPLDHYIIYRKKGIRNLLKTYGFKLKKIHVTGHHPERISPLLSKNPLGYRFLLWLSKIFSLGDTFEIYAVKE